MWTLIAIIAGCSEYTVSPERARSRPGTPSPQPGLWLPPLDTGTPTDTADCEDGYFAEYYNLPADHPEVEDGAADPPPGDLPWNHDWYDEQYLAYTVVEPGLDFGTDWWPVDEGLPGDPQYFAVRWEAVLEVDADTTATFELGSDDDSWALIDGEVVADLAGLHAVETDTFTLTLAAGQHQLELYMAERHTSQSGFWFTWSTPDIRIFSCP